MKLGKLCFIGAEAQIYKIRNTIIKVRKPKYYRHKALDERLRIFRTKREAALLSKLAASGFPAPDVLSTNNVDTIVMRFLPGKRLSDCMLLLSPRTLLFVARNMGMLAAKLHLRSIIHADLTTSNFLLDGKQLYLIDFGLSYPSSKSEDRAVDIHLLKQSLFSSHPSVANKAFRAFLSSYMHHFTHASEVLLRLTKVELRGRHKAKKQLP